MNKLQHLIGSAVLWMTSTSLYGGFLYTFSFDQTAFPIATIQYSAPTLPPVGNALMLHYLDGNVNGCSPASVTAQFQDANTIIFDSGFLDPAICSGNPSGVIGFVVVTGGISGVGTYPTSLAGRAVQGPTVHFAGGSLIVSEQPEAEPVPEPSSAVAVLLGLLAYVTLFTVRRRRQYSLIRSET